MVSASLETGAGDQDSDEENEDADEDEEGEPGGGFVVIQVEKSVWRRRRTKRRRG